MSNKSGNPVKPIRLAEEEFNRLKELSEELNFTRTKTLKMLLDIYEKHKENSLENTNTDIFKLRQENLFLKRENEKKEELIIEKNLKIQKIKKKFLKVLEEKMNLEEIIDELKIMKKYSMHK